MIKIDANEWMMRKGRCRNGVERISSSFLFFFFFDAVNLALAGFIIEIFSAKGGQL